MSISQGKTATLLFISLLQIGINVNGRAQLASWLQTLSGWTSTVLSESVARTSRSRQGDTTPEQTPTGSDH